MGCPRRNEIVGYGPVPAHLAVCPECSRHLLETLHRWKTQFQRTGKEAHGGEVWFRYRRLMEICELLISERGAADETDHDQGFAA